MFDVVVAGDVAQGRPVGLRGLRGLRGVRGVLGRPGSPSRDEVHRVASRKGTEEQEDEKKD